MRRKGWSYPDRETALAMMDDALAATGPHSFISQGTLLGAIRDGDFIKDDHDVDIAILREHWHPKMVQALRARGFRVTNIPHHGKNPPSDIVERKAQRWMAKYIGPVQHGCLSLLRGRNHVDLAIWSRGVRYGDTYRYAENPWVPGRSVLHRVPADLLESFANMTFLGREVRVPERAEEFLTWMYDEWRTPVEDWLASPIRGRAVKRRIVRS